MKTRTHLFTAIALLFAAFAFTANVALAGGAQCSHAEGAHCQNIIKTAADGGRVAVCGCGKEFTVTDDTPSIEYEGKTYFACSEQCAEQIKADPAKMIPAIEQKMEEVRKAQNISGNVMYVDEEGNRIAMCSCGAEIKVTDTTVTRESDGETYYFCCDHCASAFDTDAAGTAKKIQGKICDKRHSGGKDI